MRITLFLLLVAIVGGCGSGPPDAAAVRKQMTSEQLAVGDPIVNSVGMVLVPIPAGEFQMGTAVDETPVEQRYQKLLENPDVQQKLESGEVTEQQLREHLEQRRQEENRRAGPERPQHLVKLTKPFYIGSCEVTQQQYEAVMDERPWQGKALVEEGPDYAAAHITWEQAAEFCRKLSEQESVEYRLPTEAEWEYACRAGTTTAYNFGDDREQLGDYAWYKANAYDEEEQYPHRVGQKLPNAWALYDMHGDVWEWCRDWYAPYDAKQLEVSDPTGPEQGRIHVWRGGAFADQPETLRSANRLSFGRRDYQPEYLTGFRVVRTMNASP